MRHLQGGPSSPHLDILLLTACSGSNASTWFSKVCRPEDTQEVDRLQSLLNDLHASFKDLVCGARGKRLGDNHDEIFSGRAWTGSQALHLGLIDGVDDMRTVMRRKFGREVCTAMLHSNCISWTQWVHRLSHTLCQVL